MKKMKEWSMMMLVMLMIPLMVACSKDSEEEESVDITKAVGTWYCIKSTDSSGGYTANDLFVGHSVSIKANGTYTSTSSSFGTSGTYKVNGSKIVVNTNSGRAFMVSVFFSGDTMTWRGSGEGVSFTYVFEREK